VSEQRTFGRTLISLVTLLFTVVGAGVAFLEYRQAQQRENVERVFRYSDTLANEVDANARINKLAADFLDVWPTLAASPGADPTAWFVNTINADPDLRDAIERMAMFYDTLAVCVSEGLCDEKTARALFTQQVASFASTAYPWIAHRTKKYFAATGIQAVCLSNRFCGDETECTGLPERLASCSRKAQSQTDAVTP
jgi:hypothetical protein